MEKIFAAFRRFFRRLRRPTTTTLGYPDHYDEVG